MDNPAQESTPLTPDAAASMFAELLADPVEKTEPDDPKVDTELDTPKADKPEAEEVEAEPNAAEEGDDAPITIMVDGKPVSLTKAELADHYKNGLRQADYTRKTMEAAETRKAADAEIQKAQQERAAYAQNLTKMAAQLEGAIQQQATIEWEKLLESDPVEYLKQQHLYQQRQAALYQNQQQQQALAQQAQAEQAEQFRNHLTTQQQELLAKLPEWKDETKAKAEREAIKAHLIERGYTAKEVDGINDHKAVLLAREAMLYRQMMSKAQAAAKKVSNLPTKVERPGVAVERNPLDGRTGLAQRHAKSQSIESAAALFAGLFS